MMAYAINPNGDIIYFDGDQWVPYLRGDQWMPQFGGDQRAATVDDGQKAPAPAKTNTLADTAIDVGKSAVSGLGEGVGGLLGTGGDARASNSATAQWLAHKVGLSPESAALVGDAVGNGIALAFPFLNGPTSAEIKDFVKPVTGDFYKPQTTAGQFTHTLASYAPAAATGPGGAGRRIGMQVLAPTLGSEGAAQLAKLSETTAPYEWAARLAGAVAGGFSPYLLGRALKPFPNPPERQAHLDVLEDAGIPRDNLLAGQVTNNEHFRNLEGKYGGAAAAAVLDKQLDDVTRRMIGSVGQAPSRATPEVIAEAKARLKDRLDQPQPGRSVEDWNRARNQQQDLEALETAVNNSGKYGSMGLPLPSQMRAALVEQGRFGQGKSELAPLVRAGEAIVEPALNPRMQPGLGPLGVAATGGSMGGLLGNLMTGGAPWSTIAGGVAGAAAPFVPYVGGRLMVSGPGRRFLANSPLSKMLRDVPPWEQQAALSALLARPQPED